MKKGPTIFFQILIVLVGLGTLAFLLWEPQVEGRNAHATLFAIYFKDPFLVYAYIGSISFFVALYQTFKTLGYVRQKSVFSAEAVKALRTIKYCALWLIAFVAVGEVILATQESDDRAGGVAMGVLITVVALGIATVAAKFERVVQRMLSRK